MKKEVHKLKIALIAHDEKKDEMVNFTIAYEPFFPNMNYTQQVQLEKE